eukprot:CAMPEP_0184871406 /NCGR_PEP_ID=MMETSP0580-20130426/40701_1 /TAXON_ID=1118495 /ORGANISM="Dactyliosolen fragilissimus" /LENGTH=1005 /DNA_ID=CAMNT_0027374063 /DNA_START=1121 /DNA_END=4139 /DNA_ORIENTATION=-
MDSEESRAYSRGKRIVRTVLSAICNLVSPSNAKFKANMMKNNDNKPSDSSMISMLRNLCELLSDRGRNNKEILAQMCGLLNINTNVLEMPKHGYTQEAMDSEEACAFSQGKGIVQIVLSANAKFKGNMMKNNNNRPTDSNLISNATELVFFGNRNTRILVHSLLAKSIPRDQMKKILQQESERFPDHPFVQKQTVIGKVHFASLRRIYNILLDGKNVPKHDYSYRIDSNKLSTAIRFIQDSLCVKPGVVRDVNIAGHLFAAFPVYERGGKSIESLNEAYNNVYNQDERVGMNTFTEIVKLLTKRGESKAGLSTYYIQLRYCGNVFVWMMKRVADFRFIDMETLNMVKEKAKLFLKEWSSIEMFLMWEYSNRHLNKTSTDICHCCGYALGGSCTHIHTLESCNKCAGCFTFFCTKVKPFLQEVKDLNQNADELSELESMFRAISKLTHAVTYYMAHRLRAKVQFEEINQVKSSLKEDPSTALIVMDHKQKILQMKYREGQVEYYGKKGMSMLGTMAVQWITKTTSVKENSVDVQKEVGGFQYKFVDQVKSSLKEDPSTALIVMDHKQKILQMKYREGQVEYYGKKGMSMLGTMVVQWITKSTSVKENGVNVQKEVGGFQYKFVDYVFKGYAGQDHTQVASAIEKILERVKEHNPEVKKVIFQSDNATCFASQELIPFIYHLNTEARQNDSPLVTRWIFTEAQTGRGRLDTHFSYLNLILKSYVEDGNDVMLEEHILEAMSFRGGIAGTSGVLLNCEKLIGLAISKKFKTSIIGSRATHKLCWFEDKIEIYESSGITEPEIVLDKKLAKHERNCLDVHVENSFVSEKPPLFVQEVSTAHVPDDDDDEVAQCMSSKAQSIQQALLESGVTQNSSSEVQQTNMVITPTEAHLKWAAYPGNNPNKISQECCVKLKELYDIGKVNKKQKVGAERAHQILLDTLIFDKWDQQLDLTVPKIKAFFQMTPRKMEDVINAAEIPSEDVDEASRDIIEDELEMSALTMIESSTNNN